MTTTAIDICNRALIRIGATRISALDDDSTEAIACNAEYEPTVREALTTPGGVPFTWRFSVAQVALSLLEDTPVARWSYAWQIPTDCMVPRGVFVSGSQIEYDRYEDMIYCNFNTGVVLDYTRRPDEEFWPDYFSPGVVRDLATRLALALNRDPGLARVAGETFSWAAARRADSMAQSSRRLRGTRLMNARFRRG
jgi:hypothetical protein